MPDHRVEDGIFAGKRCGMRGRRRRADVGPADLHEDDRLFRRPCGFQRIDQDGSVLDTLRIGQDRADVVLFRHQLDDFGHLDVALIARRQEIAGAEAALTGQKIDVAAVGAGLAGNRKRSGLRRAPVQRR